MGLGWSTRHGDLRIPHFFGLHGVQIIPLFGWLVSRRRRTDNQGIGLALATTFSYNTFIGLLAWQALRGQSIVAPDTTTVWVFGVWLTCSIVAVLLLRETPPSRYAPRTSQVTL
jgi:hypothetical protein